MAPRRVGREVCVLCTRLRGSSDLVYLVESPDLGPGEASRRRKGWYFVRLIFLAIAAVCAARPIVAVFLRRSKGILTLFGGRGASSTRGYEG